MVTCETQADIDRYWDALTRGGEESQCGWLKDRYGVSWQIVPARWARCSAARTPRRRAGPMQAMLGMRKLDIATLERAREGRERSVSGELQHDRLVGRQLQSGTRQGETATLLTGSCPTCTPGAGPSARRQG